MVGSLLYPEPWSAPAAPGPRSAPGFAPGGLTLNEPCAPFTPPPVDSPGGDDGPGLLASFAPFFSDCASAPGAAAAAPTGVLRLQRRATAARRSPAFGDPTGLGKGRPARRGRPGTDCAAPFFHSRHCAWGSPLWVSPEP